MHSSLHVQAVVVPVASVEGSFLMAYARGPYGWTAQDLAACKLAAGVLNALESYFWTEIRGSGLAYGANVDVEEEHGLVNFTAYRSPDASKAFAAGGKILRDIVSGKTPLDKNLVDAAKSSLSYAYARREGNPGAAALTCFKNEVFKDVPIDHGARMLASFNDVTVNDVKAAMEKYFVPLFDSSSSVVATSCAPSLSDKLVEAFEGMGYDVETKELPSTGAVDQDGPESGSEWGDSEGSDDAMSQASG